MNPVFPNRPRTRRVILSPEQLEDRTVPSGNVTANVVGGMLRIDGDTQHNQLMVTGQEDGRAIITPLGDTTLNGGRGPITLGGIVFAYDVKLGEGNDFLWVSGTQEDIGLFVDMGGGNDGLTVDFASHTGTTALFTGGGNDVVSVGMGKFEGLTIFDTGAGDDQIVIGGGEFNSVMFNGGAGLNSVSVLDVNFHSTPVTVGIQSVFTSLNPVANQDAGTVRQGGATTINVAANDLALGGTLDLASVQITGQPQNGTVRANSDGTVTYTAGNSSARSDSFSYTITDSNGMVSNEATVSVVLTGGQGTPPQTGGPTPAITTTAPSQTNLASIPITVKFNRVVTGFTAADVQVTNGTVTDFGTTSARTFTFNVRPTADGVVAVNLPAGAAQDALGRDSTSASLTVTSDRTAPTPTIRAGSSAGQTTIPFTITFGEVVNGFTAAGVAVTGGTVSGFTTTNSRVYSFIVTPTAGADLVRVNVAAGAATDAAGNVSRVAPGFTTTATRTDAGMTSTTTPPAANDPNWVAQANGLKTWDVQTGTGPAVTSASTVSVFYTGWLLDGTVFDSAHTAGAPVSFSMAGLIQGWQQGIPGMQPGSIRRLYVPAALGYGSTGSGIIPPNADLIFEIKLIAVV